MPSKATATWRPTAPWRYLEVADVLAPGGLYVALDRPIPYPLGDLSQYDFLFSNGGRECVDAGTLDNHTIWIFHGNAAGGWEARFRVADEPLYSAISDNRVLGADPAAGSHTAIGVQGVLGGSSVPIYTPAGAPILVQIGNGSATLPVSLSSSGITGNSYWGTATSINGVATLIASVPTTFVMSGYKFQVTGTQAATSQCTFRLTGLTSGLSKVLYVFSALNGVALQISDGVHFASGQEWLLSNIFPTDANVKGELVASGTGMGVGLTLLGH